MPQVLDLDKLMDYLPAVDDGLEMLFAAREELRSEAIRVRQSPWRDRFAPSLAAKLHQQAAACCALGLLDIEHEAVKLRSMILQTDDGQCNALLCSAWLAAIERFLTIEEAPLTAAVQRAYREAVDSYR